MARVPNFSTLPEGICEQEKGRREPVTIEAYQPFLNYFDDRDFEVGTFVRKRSDSKDSSEHGIVNLKWPRRGEPALVVGHCPFHGLAEKGTYNRETMVILVFDDDGDPSRFAVDPVHFERYELPGERMLRDLAEEEKATL